MKTTSMLAAAAVFSVFVLQGTAASAGQSCWGLQGQALQDCIDKLVDDLAKTGHETNNSAQTSVKMKSATILRQKAR